MDDIKDFLDNFTLLNEVDPNFFQIAGFPHYENVSSNILSYYFEKYPFVLEIFLSCISSFDYNNSIDPVQRVEREEATENKKRIDIVIYTNKHIIGIENKIKAWLYNPIDDYLAFLESKAKEENKNYLLLVLSKNKVEKNIKYQNILYKEFSAKLKKNYPELLKNLGYKHFLLLTEYIDNIDFLDGGYFMNKEFFEIAKKEGNLEKIEQIMVEGIHLRDELIIIANKIKVDLQEYGISFEVKPPVHSEKNEFWATVFYQNCYILDKKYNVTIEVIVDIYGFEIQIYEANKQFNTEFKNILLGEILSDEKFEIRDSTRVNYREIIQLEEYDKLIKVLINIFNAFDKFIKSKNSNN